jgi:broad specificity phosphatase PhoE
VAGQRRRLILVRHSAPEMVAGVPASQWRLSEEGRLRCQKLAERLAAYGLATIVTSTEPKAVETGQIVAEVLDLPFEIAPGLHEHERGVVRNLGSREEFQAQVARLFERPAELVLGYETADQAHARFFGAVAHVVEEHPAGNLAVATHGTVMTLFIARANGLDAVPFWKRLGLPSFVVLTLPSFSLVEVVENVEKG